MNNLKRILSLALASVMVIGMMVVGASATSYPDDENIVNKEAVDTLQALGIMKGDDKGNFNPTNSLKRCEAVKMLATIHNKGREVNYGSTAGAPFPDVPTTHWASEVISYAKSFGIANGYDDGTFKPEDSLTVAQLVRMTLNMMGYTEGQSGRDWELQTTVLASDLGLFDGLDGFIPSANVSRDQAAQILVNSINAPMANGNVSSEDIYTLNGKKDGAAITPIEFDSSTAAYLYASINELTEISVTKTTNKVTESLATKYLSLQTNNTGIIAKVVADDKGTYTVTMSNGTEYTKVATNYSNLMGQKVNVLFKATDSVYGITAIGTVVYEGTVGGYTVAANDKDKTEIEATTIVEFNKFETTHGTIGTPDVALGAEQSLKVVKNGNKSYTAVTVPQKLAEVTGLTAKNATVSGVGTKEIDKEIVLNGAVKGDKVIVTLADNTVSGKVELTLAEIKENVAADAYRTVGTLNQVRINGEWLTVLKSDDFDTLKAMAKNTTYDLVMINGYVAAQDVSVAGTEAKDLLVLTAKAANPSTGLESYYEARAYFVKDGSTAVIKLPSDDKTSAAGKLYTYTEKDGIYTLEAPTAKALGYTSEIKDKGVNAKNTVNGTLIDENAQIIVLLKDGKVEVVDGKAARAWDLSAEFGASNALAYTKAVNGVNYVQFAFLTDTNAEALPGAGASGKNHGYIVSTPFTSSKGVEYKLWNGTEEIDVVDKADDANTLVKGDFIEYKVGDGFIKSTKITDSLNKDAVLGWNDADKVIQLVVKGTKVIDDKTVFLYVDTEAGKGTEGALTAADPSATTEGKYVANVMVIEGTENHIDVIVVDVKNDLGEDVGTAVTPACDHAQAKRTQKNAGGLKGDTCQTKGEGEYYLCECGKKFETATSTSEYDPTGKGQNGDHIAIENPSATTDYVQGTGTNAGQHAVKCQHCNEAASAYEACADGDTDSACDKCGATV